MTQAAILSPGIKFTAMVGMSITPNRIEIEVVGVDAETVWYRKAGSSMVQETPINRFLAAVKDA